MTVRIIYFGKRLAIATGRLKLAIPNFPRVQRPRHVLEIHPGIEHIYSTVVGDPCGPFPFLLIFCARWGSFLFLGGFGLKGSIVLDEEKTNTHTNSSTARQKHT